MNSFGSGPFEKTCLLTFFQALTIGIALSLVFMNSNFDPTKSLELKCMTLSDIEKLCISIFERDFEKIPALSPVRATALHNRKFKVLEFQQNPNRLKTKYKNQYQEYFQLIDYNHEIKQTKDLQIDQGVQEIMAFLNIEMGQFRNEALNQTYLKPQTGLAVFYFLVDNQGPIVPEPQVITYHQTQRSINLNVKGCIIASLFGIIILMGWALSQIFNSQNDNSRPPNQSLCDNPYINKVSRPTRFLIYFGLANLIVYIAANKLWSSYGIESLFELLGFDSKAVMLLQERVAQTSIDLFPEWLLLGCFIYLVLERFCGWGNIKLVLLSGIISSFLYLIPSGSGQKIFEITLIVLGLVLTLAANPLPNGSKFTATILFTTVNIIIMIYLKSKWAEFQSDENDFTLKFLYNNIFITNNILSLFYADGQVTSKTDRKYIPYEEYSMEEETEFDENSHSSRTEKI